MGKKNGLVVVIILGAIGALLFITFTSSQESKEAGVSYKSIADALSKNISLRCNFTDSEGQQFNAYIKNGDMRLTITSAEGVEIGNIIDKDKQIYVWDKDGAVNTSLDIQNITQLVNQKSPLQQNFLIYVTSVDQHKDSCKSASVDDAVFLPPQDVTFQPVKNSQP